MSFKVLNEVQKVKVKISPSWKDNFKGILEQPGNLPAIYLRGENWSFQHTCCRCKKDLEGNTPNYPLHYIGHLSGYDFFNKDFIDHIGKSFGLTLTDEIDENGFEIYDYSLVGKVKGLALVGAYECVHCKAVYLLAMMHLMGDSDRTPTPDEIYFEKIIQVDIKFQDFLEEVKRAKK